MPRRGRQLRGHDPGEALAPARRMQVGDGIDVLQGGVTDVNAGLRQDPGMLPDWLDPLFEAAEMRAVDAWAIEEQGVPSLDLMERAGADLVRVTPAAARPGPVRGLVGQAAKGGPGRVVARVP